MPDFSIPCGDTAELLIPLVAEPGIGTRAVWQLYGAMFGNPAVPPLVTKDSELHHGSGHGGIAFIASPPALAVLLMQGDTDTLLGNHVWLASLIDGAGNITTASYGVLTVTLSALGIDWLATLPPWPGYDSKPFQQWMTPPVYSGVMGVPALWRAPGAPPWGR